MHCALFILLLLAFFKKVFFSSCNFFLNYSKSTLVTKLCLNVHASFWRCSAVYFHRSLHRTILPTKNDGMSAVFPHLTSCQKPHLKILWAESLTTLGKKGEFKKKDGKRRPTDFLICLSDISPGTGAARPPTSPRRDVLNGATSNRATVTASVWRWPTVTTGGGEAINQMLEGGGSWWGCWGSRKMGKGLR